MFKSIMTLSLDGYSDFNIIFLLKPDQVMGRSSIKNCSIKL